MPLKKDLHKVLVIGSGPIIIGQAAEFDYAGTQACRALREEGLEVVLVNSNPATIMTDVDIADEVYLEPITVEFLERIIAKERPQGLLPTLGGQVGLNMAMELARSGILIRYGVTLLGTSLATIKKAEDREEFKRMMEHIHEPVPESVIVSDVEAAVAFAEGLGYPVIVRPAYTLGGTGGGIANSREELERIANNGLKHSVIQQILVEKSVAGWKEIEFEMMRDGDGNMALICSMENVDPVGIHTGDSIVVAPAQTLTGKEMDKLSASAVRIMNALGIEGGCNIQYAVDPSSFDYYVIEVNPRVSRSSALASKATGYPIARVSTKIAIGYRLEEIENAITKKTFACSEPVIDYVVLKFPRWPFDKFAYGDRKLGTQMKATGEVMAIDTTIEAALLKAIRSLEIGVNGLDLPSLRFLSNEQLLDKIAEGDDERLFAVAEALRRGSDMEAIYDLCKIDIFFLSKLLNIINLEKEIITMGLTDQLLEKAKKLGFGDGYLAKLADVPEKEIRERRLQQKLLPNYKKVDTCAAEFPAQANYLYSTYGAEDEVEIGTGQKAVVIGSGPVRIGQGVEFDYCSVHSVWALKKAGYEAIIINNNPETVSTDFDTADKLYFEPLNLEDVLNILDREKPTGVVVQFGGQTAINLAHGIVAEGYTILGSSLDSIDRAEDRKRFDELLENLHIRRPQGRTVTVEEEALSVANELGYPVLVRPSYVLGGRAMEIVYSGLELEQYMKTAVHVSNRHPVLIDKYLLGMEVEVDAISDGDKVLIPGIMEHIERAGVHSGDSSAVFPPQNLDEAMQKKIVEYTTKMAKALEVKGLLNVQFVIYEGELYVIEVNPRSSRTVPYLSKITGIPMVEIATKIILGESLADQGCSSGLVPAPRFVSVKVPVFSFGKLHLVETSLGPEMKSTGEVMGIGKNFAQALYKGFVAAGTTITGAGCILATIADRDKEEALPILRGFYDSGFQIAATSGTACFLFSNGIAVEELNKIDENDPSKRCLLALIHHKEVGFIINTLTKGKNPQRDGFQIRRAAAEIGIPCLTSLDTAKALLYVLETRSSGAPLPLVSLQRFLNEDTVW